MNKVDIIKREDFEGFKVDEKKQVIKLKLRGKEEIVDYTTFALSERYKNLRA